ncbi:MAG: tetratricopeptide repeat protein [Verrucomicrobiae bacterium]|nr:tetratricopeptide repeat protein [Verrucomicrobiae bacterium]
MTSRAAPRFALPPGPVAGGLALLAAAIYLPSLSADFAWDSVMQVRNDQFIHDLRNLPAVLTLRVLSMDVLDFNRPTQLLSLMADAAIWGRHPFGFHLTNILLHGGVTALLFLFARRLLGPWPALAAALVFAAHPLHAEAVAEVANREDLLAAFFTLAGLNAAAQWGATWRGALLTVPCFFLAVGAKESAVVAPALLALYWWWFRRAESRRAWLTLLAAASVAVGGFVVARFALEPRESLIFQRKPERLGGSWAATAKLQPRIWAFYLRQIVWPGDLCAEYGPWNIRNFKLPVAVAVLAAVIAAQVWWGRRDRAFALGAATFWLALLPVSNLVPIYQPMADRFLYLPLAGMALSVGALATRWRYGPLVLGALALPLAPLTWQQQQVWRDELSLWQHTVQKNPGSLHGYNNLGCALVNAGRLDEALRMFERSLQVSEGKNPDTWAQIALILNERGRTAEADEAFRKAVELDPRLADPDVIARAVMWEAAQIQRWRTLVERNRTGSRPGH